MAGVFLRLALRVEGDEAGDDVGRGEVGGPAISVGDGGIDLFVEAMDDEGAGGGGAIEVVPVNCSPAATRLRKL